MTTLVKQKKNGEWQQSNMPLSIDAIKNKEIGFLKASKTFGVPKTTLRRHLKGDNKYALNGKKHVGRQVDLPEDIEAELVRHAIDLEARFYGLTQQNLRRLAYQIAEINQVKTRFNHDQKRDGKKWLRGFFKRHPEILLRLPEATSLTRASGFNRNQIDAFFNLLTKTVEENNISADTIYMDESGISVVQKMTEVLAKKGKRQIGSITSMERGQTVTIICSNNAAGIFVPPGFIFPRVRMKPELTDGAPPGSMFACQVSVPFMVNSTQFLH